ncbi:AAE3, partial [Symbiodinium microadriaticum]
MPISTPNQDYNLIPVGTSGTAVGPDILIVSDDGLLTPLPTGQRGCIFIRGPPCFHGYEESSNTGENACGISPVFHTVNGEDGWFDTGDMGYMDAQGYLFISGRSKEIINRGGETISPFEIEEALQQHPAIKEVMCFATPHNQFQETIGAVVVVETGKILRVRFSSRASLSAIDEDTAASLRLFEGKCPAQGAPLTSPVSLTPVELNIKFTESFLAQQEGVNFAMVVLLDLPSRRDAVVAFVSPATADLNTLQLACADTLHSYLCPYFMHATDSLAAMMLGDSDTPSEEAAEALIAQAVEIFTTQSVVLPRTDVEHDLELIWREQLMFERVLSVTSSFFELGGDSLRAGALVNAIRKEFCVGLTVADLFTAPTIEGMAHRIDFLRKIESNLILDDVDYQYDDVAVKGDKIRAGQNDTCSPGDMHSTLFNETSNWEYSMKHSSTAP